MKEQEELMRLREAKGLLQEQVKLQKQLITQQQEQIRLQEQHSAHQREQIRLLVEENSVLQQRIVHLNEQVTQLSEQVKRLQERQAKDSHNSSLPPSSDRFTRQPKSLRKKSEKPSGGQDGHPGSTLALSQTPDEVIRHGVQRCEQCQQDLTEVPPLTIERRQVIELPPPRAIVREHQAEAKCCPSCQHRTKAPFPPQVHAPVQYGASIGARAVYLSHQQLLPFARVCEVLKDLLGIAMSEGCLRDLIERCHQNLEGVEQQIKQALSSADLFHQDETGVYVANRRLWAHTTSTSTLTYYHIHANRGRKALEAMGILPDYRGISVHDGFGSYFRYACQHALCNVHILRELTFLAEEQGLWWAAKLKALLLDMKLATEQARALGKHWLHPLEVVDWEQRFEALLEDGDQAHPRATAPPGQRGRIKQSHARNLLDRLRKHQQAVLAFLEDLRVPFDNNQAERDLRMLKVQQKVSGCFRSMAGAQAFARIRGYLSTLRKQNMPLLAALQATLLGHPILPSM
jgi:transposase